MEEEIKKIDDKEFEEFYKTFGSDSLNLQGKILGDLGEKKIDIYFKSIGFTTTVIGVVGLLAGFGFTAFDYIQSKFSFFLGEGFLIGSLFLGLFWAQKVYQSEFNSLDEEGDKLSSFYNERNDILIGMVDFYIENKSIKKEELQKLVKKDRESINLFKNEAKNKKQQHIYSKTMYVFMILGSINLLISFFLFDIIKLII